MSEVPRCAVHDPGDHVQAMLLSSKANQHGILESNCLVVDALINVNLARAVGPGALERSCTSECKDALKEPITVSGWRVPN